MASQAPLQPEIESLRAEVKQLRDRLQLVESRPVAVEKTEIKTTNEATPAWIRALIVIASALLVPTLSWGAVQLYGLNRQVGEVRRDIVALREEQRRDIVALREEQQRTREMIVSGLADIRADMRARK